MFNYQNLRNGTINHLVIVQELNIQVDTGIQQNCKRNDEAKKIPTTVSQHSIEISVFHRWTSIHTYIRQFIFQHSK